jgi:hypothetical protein
MVSVVVGSGIGLERTSLYTLGAVGVLGGSNLGWGADQV